MMQHKWGTTGICTICGCPKYIFEALKTMKVDSSCLDMKSLVKKQLEKQYGKTQILAGMLPATKKFPSKVVDFFKDEETVWQWLDKYTPLESGLFFYPVNIKGD